MSATFRGAVGLNPYAAALAVPCRDQIAVGKLTDNLPPARSRRLQALGLALAGVILLAALPRAHDRHRLIMFWLISQGRNRPVCPLYGPPPW